MILFKHAKDITGYLQSQLADGKKMGFIPTMGALHAGHLSLIEQSRRKTDITVCSIFVNPTQFNDPGDFLKYPVTIGKDIQLLESAGTDILFLPSVETIYPSGISNLSHYDLGAVENILEGKFRPGHFQGVCQVMHRLLEIVTPEHLYMGSKDYQQCMVVSRLLQLTGITAELHKCPTLREPDGLAMSSRNARLDPEQRQRAAAVSKALLYIKENMTGNSLPMLKQHAREMLEKEQFRVDYVEIADAETLEPMDSWNGNDKLRALIAAFLGEVRLIDNMAVSG